MTGNCRKDFCSTLRQSKVFILYKKTIHTPEIYGVEEVLYVDVENKAPSTVNRSVRNNRCVSTKAVRYWLCNLFLIIDLVPTALKTVRQSALKQLEFRTRRRNITDSARLFGHRECLVLDWHLIDDVRQRLRFVPKKEGDVMERLCALKIC